MANNKALALTDKGIQALKKPTAKKWVRDGGGLALCLTPAKSGAWRHWYFIYVSPETGKKIYKPLGSYPELSLGAARETTLLLRADISKSVDPKEEERRDMEAKLLADAELRRQREAEEKTLTVSKLVDEYLTKYAMPKKTSWQEDRRILYKDVVPIWGARKAESITRRDVLTLLDNLRVRGEGITTNTFKIVRRMFRYAVKQEIIGSTPCYAFERGEELPRPVSRERTLKESEIRDFLLEIDKCAISCEIRKILKLVLVTGQRPGEVASMHSNEINGRWWEFTPKETIVTKQIPRKQRIYLTDMALELIGTTEGYIFPSPKQSEDENGNPIFTPIEERSVAYALRRNLSTHQVQPKAKKVAKPKRKKPFVVAEDKKLNIEKFTPHDLRRTCATMLSTIGFSDEIVDAVLSHLKKGEIRTYNKNSYDREKQQAMEAWERKLNAIMHDTQAMVVPIRSSRKQAV